jgi:hypothetical protein
VGFEPTTPGLKVRDPFDEPAIQAASGGIGDGVPVQEAGLDHLPQKQKAAPWRPSPCMRCDCIIQDGAGDGNRTRDSPPINQHLLGRPVLRPPTLCLEGSAKKLPAIH